MTATPTPILVPSQPMWDHPGWIRAGHRCARRALRCGETTWMITSSITHNQSETVIKITLVAGTGPEALPALDVFDPETLPSVLHDRLLVNGFGRLHRIRNPDLWDAILPPFFGHRRRLSDAMRLYQRFCTEFGPKVATETGNAVLAPRPEEVTSFGDDVLSMVGLGRRGHALRALAHDFIQSREDFTSLAPASLFRDLQNVRGIGKWTAATVVADTTNNFEFYTHVPYGPDYHWHQFMHRLGFRNRANDNQPDRQALTSEELSTLVALMTRHPIVFDPTHNERPGPAPRR